MSTRDVKLGIKFLTKLSYEQFENFQYLLDYDFDYFDMEESIAEQEVIALDIDDEEREEDLEVLHALLTQFDHNEVKYELYGFHQVWEKQDLSQIILNKSET